MKPMSKKKSGLIDVRMLVSETGDAVAIFVNSADGMPLDYQEIETIVTSYFDHLHNNTIDPDSDLN